MAVFSPRLNCSSASVRSARLTELWWMKTSTPEPPRAWATRLGLGAALDEDEALLAAGALGDRQGGVADVVAELDPQVALRPWAGRVDQAKRAVARALQPLADHVGVADRRGQADALDVAAAHRADALEQRSRGGRRGRRRRRRGPRR
jgi:hypothetical protein